MHTQWPVTREISNSSQFRRVWPAPWWHDALRPLLRIARFLPASWLVQRSSVEGTSQFRCGSTATSCLENLSVTPRFAFSACQCFTYHSRGSFLVMARSASVALGEVGQQIRFRVRVLLLEYVSTFLLRLVPTLVSLLSPVYSLSALFSSSRFPASLVSFGYLVFCLLFLQLTCVLFVCLSPHCADGIGQ